MIEKTGVIGGLDLPEKAEQSRDRERVYIVYEIGHFFCTDDLNRSGVLTKLFLANLSEIISACAVAYSIVTRDI